MQVYLVGGAVRDKLLSIPVKEKDWVVVGSSPEQMLSKGYKQVGKDFPVFLHPKTNQEYALARTERKSGRGYKGFSVNADPSVTLEEDLMRRDLTINAIAMDDKGVIIDPFAGREDIKNKILRHVSPAFTEDPLRVIRIARFGAKLKGFNLASETLDLCRQIASSGELAYLSKDRMQMEWQKVCECPDPERFVDILVQTGAWQQIMPYCKDYLEDQKNLRHVKKCGKSELIMTVLGLYLSEEQWGILWDSLDAAKKIKQLAKVVYILNSDYDLRKKSASQILSLLCSVDFFRRKERFKEALEVVGLLHPIGLENVSRLWFSLLENFDKFSIDKEVIANKKGEQIAKEIYKMRLEVILEWEKTVVKKA